MADDNDRGVRRPLRGPGPGLAERDVDRPEERSLSHLGGLAYVEKLQGSTGPQSGPELVDLDFDVHSALLGW
jgi:hypothetical protein